MSVETKIWIHKARHVALLIWQVVWRASGLALMTFPLGMGVGAGIDALPGVDADPLLGGLTAFASSFAVAVSAIGKSIAVSGKAELDAIEKAFRKAVSAAEDSAAAKKN